MQLLENYCQRWQVSCCFEMAASLLRLIGMCHHHDCWYSCQQQALILQNIALPSPGEGHTVRLVALKRNVRLLNDIKKRCKA